MNASLPLGNTPIHTAFCAVLLVAASACTENESDAGSFKDDEGTAGAARLVYDVTEVSAELSANLPSELYIHASGHTRTGGWTEVALMLDEEASEGIHLVYRFVAVPPEGMATQAITPIDATVAYGPYNDRAGRVIEIVAETNTMTITYPTPAQE
jgi:hypothetical protein